MFLLFVVWLWIMNKKCWDFNKEIKEKSHGNNICKRNLFKFIISILNSYILFFDKPLTCTSYFLGLFSKHCCDWLCSYRVSQWSLKKIWNAAMPHKEV